MRQKKEEEEEGCSLNDLVILSELLSVYFLSWTGVYTAPLSGKTFRDVSRAKSYFCAIRNPAIVREACRGKCHFECGTYCSETVQKAHLSDDAEEHNNTESAVGLTINRRVFKCVG